MCKTTCATKDNWENTAELYAIASCVAEALGFESFLQEAELFTNINLHVFVKTRLILYTIEEAMVYLVRLILD